MVSWKRVVIAVGIFIAYFLLITPYFLTIQDTLDTVSDEYNNLIKPPQPLNFVEPIAINTISEGSAFVQDTDIAVNLNITYPLGTLIVNENVNIFATAFLNITTKSANLTSFIIGFQNGLASPITYRNNIPLNGIFQFYNPYAVPNAEAQSITLFNNTSVAYGNMTIVWHAEGDYKPIIQLNFYDNTSRVVVDDSLVFHVYPLETLTQIETNKIALEANIASLKLSQGVLILGTIAIFALCVQIVDHTDYKCNYPENNVTKRQDCPYLVAKRRHEFYSVKRELPDKKEATNANSPEKEE